MWNGSQSSSGELDTRFRQKYFLLVKLVFVDFKRTFGTMDRDTVIKKLN